MRTWLFPECKKRRDIIAFKSNAMKQLLAECSVSICDNIDFFSAERWSTLFFIKLSVVKGNMVF